MLSLQGVMQEIVSFVSESTKDEVEQSTKSLKYERKSAPIIGN